jgi:hypothetical protein
VSYHVTGTVVWLHRRTNSLSGNPRYDLQVLTENGPRELRTADDLAAGYVLENIESRGAAWVFTVEGGLIVGLRRDEARGHADGADRPPA